MAAFNDPPAKFWYLVYAKPRQEEVALTDLVRQVYGVTARTGGAQASGVAHHGGGTVGNEVTPHVLARSVMMALRNDKISMNHNNQMTRSA
jgi:hypothetical protein